MLLYNFNIMKYCKDLNWKVFIFKVLNALKFLFNNYIKFKNFIYKVKKVLELDIYIAGLLLIDAIFIILSIPVAFVYSQILEICIILFYKYIDPLIPKLDIIKRNFYSNYYIKQIPTVFRYEDKGTELIIGLD